MKYLNNNWAVSILAGVLLGLSFPPINLAFLSIPAFLLLFKLVDETKSNKELAYYSYFGFVIWNLITTYWLMMASLAAGVAAILANSLLMVIPLLLFRFFSKKLNSAYLIALLQAAAWVSYEYLHHHWDLAWPWLAIGNAWSNFTPIIQYISVTGHLGITFWVILSSALLHQYLKRKESPIAIISGAVFLIFPLLSLFGYFGKGEEADSYTEVAIIQPNHDSYQRYGGMSGMAEVVDSLFSITEKTITENTGLIVWPENAIEGQIYLNSGISRQISNAALRWNSAFIVGTGLVELYDNPPKLYRGFIQGHAYNIFNSALYVDKNGHVSHYNKANLVPIVERVPFLDFLSSIDIFDWVNWGEIGGYGKGNEASTLVGDSFITGGPVCYDSVYPAWIREFVKNDSNFITIITNDGWWGRTSGHHQHFAYARLRAIEFDRWIVRSANNGISGIIDNKGKVLVKTDYWERTGFVYDVPSLKNQTIYAKYGDWFSYLMLVFTFFGWGYSIFVSRDKAESFKV